MRQTSVMGLTSVMRLSDLLIFKSLNIPYKTRRFYSSHGGVPPLFNYLKKTL